LVENGRNQKFVFTIYHVDGILQTSIGFSMIQVQALFSFNLFPAFEKNSKQLNYIIIASSNIDHLYLL